jgi:hypothetical protein
MHSVQKGCDIIFRKMVEPMEVDIKPDIIEQPVLQSVFSEEEKRCSICLDDFTNKKILELSKLISKV